MTHTAGPVSKVVRIFALLVFVSLAAEPAAFACSCETPGEACAAYWKTSAVFLGRVESIVTYRHPSTGRPGRRQVLFTVLESYRGVATTSIRVETGVGGGDCGVPFETNATYVVYASSSQGVLHTGICSRTHRVEDADSDVEYGRAIAAGLGPASRITGDVRLGSRPQDGFGGPPLGGIDVRLERGGETVAQVRTDEQGAFVVEGLPAGKYDVALVLGDKYYARLSSEEADLPDAHACAGVQAAVFPNGRITGRVLDADGRPVPGLTVDFATAADLDRPWTTPFRAMTDRSGRYEVVHLPPGRFVVGINTQRDRDGQFREPRVLFPGVEQTARATRVAVPAGERIELADFVLPPTIAYVAIEGYVLEPDGSPAADARVFLKGPSEIDYILSEPVVTGADGAFVLAALTGRGYRVFAERVRDPSAANGPVDSTEQVMLTATPRMAPIILKLRRRY